MQFDREFNACYKIYISDRARVTDYADRRGQFRAAG